MARTEHTHRQSGIAGRLSGLLVFALFLALGLIGLVLPVIPGLLFLMLALYVLTRQSRRVAGAANRHAGLRRALRRIGQVQRLAPRERLQLGFWVTARAMVSGTATLARGIGSLVNGNRRHSGDQFQSACYAEGSESALLTESTGTSYEKGIHRRQPGAGLAREKHPGK